MPADRNTTGDSTVEVELLLLNAKEVAAALNVSLRHVAAMHSTGRLGPLPIRLGRRTLWRAAELVDWVERGCLPRERWISDNHG